MTLGDARRQHVDSHNRLFGDVDRMSTPAKNHFKSSIPIGGEEGVDGSTKHSNGGHYDQENGMNGKHAGNDNFFIIYKKNNKFTILMI